MVKMQTESDCGVPRPNSTAHPLQHNLSFKGQRKFQKRRQEDCKSQRIKTPADRVYVLDMTVKLHP